jgi:hypothetical protein
MYQWFKIDPHVLPLNSLSGGAIKAFIALASIVDERGNFHVTYELLHKSIGVSRRTAIRALSELEEAEILWRTNGPGQCLSGFFKKGVSVGRGSDPQNKPLAYQRIWSMGGGVTTDTT